MSSNSSPQWTFGQLAPDLEANGYQPIPISLPDPTDPSAGKRPAIFNWQIYRPVVERLSAYAKNGVGILTAFTPGIDIDVMDPMSADEIEQRVAEIVGEGPKRIGQFPKRLLLFQTTEPFSKMATDSYRLPGDDADAKLHRVEVLGNGQQFVAFGIHPITQLPYTWPDWSPVEMERAGLPELTEPKARQVIEAVNQVLRRAGGVTDARASGPGKPIWQRSSGPPPRMIKGMDEAGMVLATLDRIDPNDLDYDGWMKVAYGIKAAFGERGRDLWLQWSAHSAKDHPETTMKTWNGVQPSRAGWRYLLTLKETFDA